MSTTTKTNRETSKDPNGEQTTLEAPIGCEVGAERRRAAAVYRRDEASPRADDAPLVLYAEELDVETGRHLGNFPQAVSHLAQVQATVGIVLADLFAEISG
jgi:hypothetical protein